MGFKPTGGVRVETIVFEGHRYNRYPDSPNAAHRRYFARAGARLHREIWVRHNGAIPEGWQIHHINGDPADNRIENLECMSRARHREEHHADYVARGKSPAQRELLARIRPKATEWHRSPEGREWHRQNARTSLHQPGKPKPFSKSRYARECLWCGTAYVAKNPRSVFCSPKCSGQHSRFKRGVSRNCHPHYAARLQSDC